MLFLKYLTQNSSQKDKPLSPEFHLFPSSCPVFFFFPVLILSNKQNCVHLYQTYKTLHSTSALPTIFLNSSSEQITLLLSDLSMLCMRYCKMICFTVVLSAFSKYWVLSWLLIHVWIHMLSLCELWFSALHAFWFSWSFLVLFIFSRIDVLQKQ